MSNYRVVYVQNRGDKPIESGSFKYFEIAMARVITILEQLRENKYSKVEFESMPGVLSFNVTGQPNEPWVQLKHF